MAKDNDNPFRDDGQPELTAQVLPEWVDYNGHMNVAYYVLVFDLATDALLDRLGLGAGYRAEAGMSLFVGEAHVTYDREVTLGQSLTVISRVLGADAKRLQVFHEMFAQGLSGIVASNEVLCLNVDLSTRRAAPFPEDTQARILPLAKRHAAHPLPSRAGRRIRPGAGPSGVAP